ncbi:MAG: LCP family protein [Tissierellaceae bacterium]|nr:LCP family protein [Tissierellaceae bacterium]
MKTFSKVFIVSFLCFLLALYIGSSSYVKENHIKLESNVNHSGKKEIEKIIIEKIEVKPKDIEEYDNLKEAMEKSNRVNFLFMGLEDTRSDTIMFASFCPDTKKIDIINIPRDTYIHRKGYDGAEQRKINSIYREHGALGMKKTVSYILNEVPIHHVVTLDYEGVVKIVDGLGGVEVDVPFHMKYDDPTAKPPLKIDISPGKQVLDGKNSLGFIRYRKGNNNKGGYIDGDLGRIKAQQEFIKSFIAKASDNLITVVTKGFQHVKTDMSLFTSLSYGRKALGMGTEDFNISTLPGRAEFKKVGKKVLSYYIYDKEKINKALEEIYNVNSPNQSD